MVKYYTTDLDIIFMALADATRRDILTRLAESDCTVSELAEPFDMSLPAISKHIRILENAGMIERAREGRIHRLRLVARPMKDAAEWMARYRTFWEDRFDALDKHLRASLRKGGEKK